MNPIPCEKEYVKSSDAAKFQSCWPKSHNMMEDIWKTPK